MTVTPVRVLDSAGPQCDDKNMKLPEAPGRNSDRDCRCLIRDPRLTQQGSGTSACGCLEGMAQTLEASGRYRILRRIEQRAVIEEPDGTPTRRAIFVDVETTGLDATTDVIVELAMLPFDFTEDGRIFAVHDPFNALREPGRPIPAAGGVPNMVRAAVPAYSPTR